MEGSPSVLVAFSRGCEGLTLTPGKEKGARGGFLQ